MKSEKTMSGAERMLAACQRQPVDVTPVWFMRQAGRCLPEYRKLRKKYDILTIAKTPELAAQVALMPVERLQVDASVIYADIMLPLQGMGVPFYIEPDIGPIIEEPVRTEHQIEALKVAEAEEATPYVFDAIRMLRGELGGRAAVVGFSGAPFTLACYMIEGRPSRDYPHAKALMLGQPEMWHRFMAKVTDVTVRYLHGQIAAGAQVVQLFDSWVGILSPDQYERFVLSYSKRVFTEVRKLGVPSIHFGTGAASLLEMMADAGSDIVSIDWRVPLDKAWSQIGYNLGIQGNLDPTALLAPFDIARDAAQDVLRRAGGRAGHIFNLGHGVMAETDPDNLARLVEFVHEVTSSRVLLHERLA